MKILEEIRNGFAVSTNNQALKIKTLPDSSPAWIIRQDGWYGVGIPVPEDKIVSEQFSNAKLHTKEIIIQGTAYNMLMLSSSVEELRMEFAAVCAHFADPGESGSERKSLADDPVAWWERWRNLLGNSIQNKPTYSVLGELMVFKYLFEQGENPDWKGTEGSTHDIELSERSFEVKSTISRYDLMVTINGQFQLLNRGKQLNLIFCRFEPSNLGISINSVVEDLVSAGVSRDRLNSQLAKMGLEIGSSARAEKFKLHEARSYTVDEGFPAITPYSFKGDRMPEAIKKITYKVDLSNIDYEGLVLL